MPDKYFKSKEACKRLNVHPRTLYQWDAKGGIDVKRTKGNMRLYNVDKYLREIKIKNNVKCICEDDYDKLDDMKDKLNIFYVRVSSNSQKDVMESQ